MSGLFFLRLSNTIDDMVKEGKIKKLSEDEAWEIIARSRELDARFVSHEEAWKEMDVKSSVSPTRPPSFTKGGIKKRK